jgi:hypothetical protein
MKAAVVRACFYDPDVNPVWAVSGRQEVPVSDV